VLKNQPVSVRGSPEFDESQIGGQNFLLVRLGILSVVTADQTGLPIGSNAKPEHNGLRVLYRIPYIALGVLLVVLTPNSYRPIIPNAEAFLITETHLRVDFFLKNG
jgi:hypothetical protein